METRSILLAFVITLNVYTAEAQLRDPNTVKQQATSALKKKSTIRLELPYKPEKKVSNGAINIYAVVVGIGAYSAMPRLNYTEDDARQFYAHLKSSQGGAVPAANISLLLDRDATLKNIMQALQKMSQKADANDVFIFYFSGHGVNGAFLPVDFDGYDRQLYHEVILRILENSAARQKLCIADACYSGSLDANNTLVAKGYTNSVDCYYDAFEKAQSGTALLMSSNPSEASLEDRTLRHGVFTYFLMKGMKGPADFNRDQIITIQELYHYVYHYVAEYTEGEQTPVLAGNYDNKMPIAFSSSVE